MANVCAVPLCPALRVKHSYLCAAHDADARNKRAFTGTEKQPKKPVRVKPKKLDGMHFALQCKLAGIPEPIPEYTFHPIRKWRADFCFLDARLLMEVEGGVFKDGGGRHNRGKGFRDDLEKYAEAAILGYRLIRVLPEWIEDGRALTYVERALTGSNK